VALSNERIAAFNIKGRPDSPVESLSGGNQQRTLLSLLPEIASLILVEHPTRGLDIESTIYIWGKLKERCTAGTAILFISSDLDEILRYSDKVLVFFAGKLRPHRFRIAQRTKVGRTNWRRGLGRFRGKQQCLTTGRQGYYSVPAPFWWP
jgi:ABC-type uncharacterized transport systems, ATPase components